MNSSYLGYGGLRATRGGGGLVTKLCPTLATVWNVAFQAPLSMGFSRQESWSGVPFPPPGNLPDAGIRAAPLASL